jgi:hypothetical protein
MQLNSSAEVFLGIKRTWNILLFPSAAEAKPLNHTTLLPI